MRALIIGLGWLGLPLANHLQQHKFTVFGTTRCENKAQELRKLRYNSYAYELFDLNPSQIPKEAIEGSKVIVNIAPGRKTIDASAYLNVIKSLIEYLVSHNAEQIVFISTTSVFGDKGGIVSENTPTSPVTNSGIAHAQIEDFLLAKYSTRSVVLRLAGLVGPNLDGSMRHPVFSLVKRDSLEAGHQRVNLVHQSDVINIIHALIQQNKVGEIYHACATEHPSRREYYNWAASELGLQAPNFCAKSEQHTPAISKTVDATASLKKLAYALKHPSPYDML